MLAVKGFNMMAGIGVTPELFKEDELKKIKNKVLIVIGDNDLINSPKSIEIAKQYIGKIKTEVVAKAGHTVALDQPQKADDLIIQFLSAE